MTYSPSVTLFTLQDDPSRRPLTLVLSTLIHAAVIAVVSFGIIYAPRVDPHITEHYVVRKLELHQPDRQPLRAAKGIEYPAAKAPGRTAPSMVVPRHAMRMAVQAQAGPQTILQPDLPQRLAQAEEIPVPQVLIWTPRRAVVKSIVPPTPEQPTAARSPPIPRRA